VNRKELLAKVQQEIDDAVTPIGFVRAEPDAWVRDARWKTDSVELSRRKPTKSSFFINLGVSIPPEPGTVFDAQLLGFINLPAAVGHLDGAYYYADKPNRLLERIRSELGNVGTWFAQFETSAKCLEYLRTKGDIDHTLPAYNSPAYKYCEEYLSSLEI
jgi:hypothetical protein